MGRTAAPAKITQPILIGCLPRKKSYRALDSARKRPLVWIAGPPGSGKTTLASSYIRERRLPAVWYQVDEGDADIATFFYYLALAGKRAAPHRKKPLPLLTPEYLPGLAVFMRRFFEDLFTRLKAPSVLVFDNCQSVADDSLLHEALVEATSLLPRRMNVIVISRSDPPPAYSRLRAGGRMQIIGWRELRLTPEETKGIARLRGKTRPDDAAARLLHSRTGGWAAGLVLLLERARLDGVEPGSLKRQAPEEIVDYFSSEILRNLDQGTREFLLRSAFLPRLNAMTAAALTGESRAGRILSFLHRHNYFTQRLLSDEPVYEFHDLFREFLLSRAVEAFPPEEIRRIRRTAGGLLEEAGQFGDAVGLYRSADDREGLARIVMTQAPSLLAQGRGGMLLEWMSHIPQEAIARNPWLLCWKGFCLLPMNPAAAGTTFETAFGIFRSLREPAGAFLSWAGAVESITFGLCDFSRLDHWIATMDVLLREHERVPSAEIETRVISAMVKALFCRQGASGQMEYWARRAEILSRSPDVALANKFEAVFSLALFRFVQGDLANLGTALKSLNELSDPVATPLLPRLMAAWMESAHCLMTAEFDHCLELVSRGLAQAAAGGVHVLDGHLLGSGALALMHLGNLPAARELLVRMGSMVDTRTPYEQEFFHFLSACHALGMGNASEAMSHAVSSCRSSQEVGMTDSLVLTGLLSALVAHANGDFAQQECHMRNAHDILQRSDTRTIHAQHALVATFLSLKRGNGFVDPQELASGLRFAREAGVYTSYICRPGLLERLAAAALEAGIEVEYAREVIRRNRLKPGAAHADLEQWPWLVKINTLGRFELLLHERPVEFPRKVQQKPLLLLKTLIAMGGRDVPEARLTDALWPEADGDLAHQAFSAALHRLRKILGPEESLLFKEGKLSLSADICWVDAWVFARLVAQAEEECAAGGGAGRRTATLRKAIALYQGPFLPHETSDASIEALRRRLRDTFLRAAEALGRHHEAAGQWEEAIPCYRRAVEADELSEPLLRRLVACCAKAGREAEAAAARRAYESALAASRRA